MMFTPYQLYPKGYFRKKHYTDVIQTDGQKKTTTRRVFAPYPLYPKEYLRKHPTYRQTEKNSVP